MMKVRYDVDSWSDSLGTISSMRFESQREAFELAKKCAKTTLTFLDKLTWLEDGSLKTERVIINADGTWTRIN